MHPITRFRVLIGAIVIVMLVPCLATDVVRIPIKKKGAGPLFQVHHGQKWGYVDRTGKSIIAPQFDDEGDFFSGLAKVRKDNKWGYINDAGRMVIPDQFDDAGDFRDELAPVRVDRKWGFINLSGKFVASPQFQAAAEFSDGVALFEVWDTVGCDPINPEKRPALYTTENAPLRAFRLHGIASIATGGCFPSNARFGFIDKKGNVTIEPRFLAASNFSEGLAAVRAEKSSDKYGYIDRAGKVVIEPQFDQARSFSEGLAAVEIGLRAQDGRKVAGQWGFINREGKFEIPARFEEARPFSEGLAEVRLQDGRWGYINGRGVLAISPKYSRTDAFSDGLALVWPDDEEGGYYIDRTGKKALIIELWPQWSFSDGLTVAGQPGERKYVNREGKIVAPYEVDPGI
jgi:hypothetical protein